MNLQKWITQQNLGIALIVLIGVNAILAVYLVVKAARAPVPIPMATETSPLVEENILASPPAAGETPTPIPISGQGLAQVGAVVLSMSDGENYHLFAYHPQFLPFTRLTNGPWDDINPVISPDGRRVAFTSRASGFWDIHLLDLSTGQISQITNSADYEGSPTWSSDGQWLAYESPRDGNLEVFLLSLGEPDQEPIQLTQGEGMSYSPSWSPGGREIAFISTRTGEPEVWLAKLDQVEDRYTNLSRNSETDESHPVWSPDGNRVAWVSNDGNQDVIVIWDAQNRETSSRENVPGSWPAWDPTSQNIVTTVSSPNHTDLAIFSIRDNRLVVPQANLPGSIAGISWIPGSQAVNLPRYMTAANMAPTPVLYEQKPTQAPGPGGRKGVLPLKNVDAPYGFLQDLAIESYESLRKSTGVKTGWDFLAQLENAYLPLTEPPEPGGAENWLFTGRAFAVNTLPIQAGWMTIARENFNGLPYWRVYLKALKQDGTQGVPITQMVWDFTPRFQGDPIAYEKGGKEMDPPPGWWVDFTELSRRFGWDRLPGMSNWRTYYRGTRFNQFIYAGLEDWQAAMEELYPPEAIATYTPIPTITQTPTRTPWKAPTRTATRTRTPTRTPTPSPTLTK